MCYAYSSRLGLTPTQSMDARGLGLLSMACRQPDATKAVAMKGDILKAGADATVLDDIGCIPLHAAVDGGHVGIIDLLLEHSPNSVNHYAEGNTVTPLCVATMEGRDKAARRLLAAGAKNKEVTEEDDLMLGLCPVRSTPSSRRRTTATSRSCACSFKLGWELLEAFASSRALCAPLSDEDIPRSSGYFFRSGDSR